MAGMKDHESVENGEWEAAGTREEGALSNLPALVTPLGLVQTGMYVLSFIFSIEFSHYRWCCGLCCFAHQR
jgi:hypothetical protein